MNTIRLIAIALPVILLMGCGGGGAAVSGGNDRVSHPIETRSLGSRVVMIGGDDGVAPLSGLSSFTPSIASPTMLAVREIDLEGEHYAMLTLSDISEIGSCCKPIGLLPGDLTEYAYSFKFFNGHDAIELPLPMIDLSLVHSAASSCSVTLCGGSPEDYFADSTYRSRTSSTATIGDVTLARGSLEVTRAHDNTPLEFQTFAGWFDGRIFATKQISIGESGSKQYRFIAYYLAPADFSPASSGGRVSFLDGGTIPNGTGSAIWEGVAVASIKDVAAIEHGWSFIRGDSTIDIDDLANPDVDLRFDNWHLIDGREISLPAVIFEGAEINESGSFISLNDNLAPINGFHGIQAEGVFHGDNQEQVGGYFDTETLMGAFGAVRQE